MPKVPKIDRLPPDQREWVRKEIVERGFGDYDGLALDANARGIDAGGKSSIGRYGARFKEVLRDIELSTEQARIISQSAPDEAGDMNEAMTRVLQNRIFHKLLNYQDDPDEQLDLPKTAKAVTDLTKSSLLQKKWAMDTREKAERAAMEVASIGKKAGLSDEYADEIRRKILGVAS